MSFVMMFVASSIFSCIGSMLFYIFYVGAKGNRTIREVLNAGLFGVIPIIGISCLLIGISVAIFDEAGPKISKILDYRF